MSASIPVVHAFGLAPLTPHAVLVEAAHEVAECGEAVRARARPASTVTGHPSCVVPRTRPGNAHFLVARGASRVQGADRRRPHARSLSKATACRGRTTILARDNFLS